MATTSTVTLNEISITYPSGTANIDSLITNGTAIKDLNNFSLKFTEYLTTLTSDKVEFKITNITNHAIIAKSFAFDANVIKTKNVKEYTDFVNNALKEFFSYYIVLGENLVAVEKKKVTITSNNTMINNKENEIMRLLMSIPGADSMTKLTNIKNKNRINKKIVDEYNDKITKLNEFAKKCDVNLGNRTLS